MHMLKHMDPNLYQEVLRKRTRVWEELFGLLTEAWSRRCQKRASWRREISTEDILADLAHGRD